LIEARNEAENILAALEKARRDEAWRGLSPEDKKEIGRLEHKLKQTQTVSDYKVIRTAIDQLNQATTPLAEMMMEGAVSSALKGKEMGALSSEGPEAPHPIAPADIE